MKDQVEAPLIAAFSGRTADLEKAGRSIGGRQAGDKEASADVALVFTPLPRIPVMLLFWDTDPADGFDAKVKLLFDETITEHLDIESIIFLSERLRQLLCGDQGDDQE